MSNSEGHTDSITDRPASPEGCIATTFERAYYHVDKLFIKRSLRPSEYRTSQRGLHVPRLGKERLQNEAECLRFVAENTDVPVPAIHAAFEVDESFCLITEYVDGVSMAGLTDAQKEFVTLELRKHLDTLHSLKSKRIGGPTGIVIPPYRAMKLTDRAQDTARWPVELEPKVSSVSDYAFCHNDLS
ncbi:hypothetical protein BDW69DRAFT_186682 [Aspergillus filifer]